MPEISRFLGIVIGMYYKDHNPPHFHAYYGEHEAAARVARVAISGLLAAIAVGVLLRLIIMWLL